MLHKKVLKYLNLKRLNQKGGVFIEYTMLVGFISVAGISTLLLFGGGLANIFSSAAENTKTTHVIDKPHRIPDGDSDEDDDGPGNGGGDPDDGDGDTPPPEPAPEPDPEPEPEPEPKEKITPNSYMLKNGLAEFGMSGWYVGNLGFQSANGKPFRKGVKFFRGKNNKSYSQSHQDVFILSQHFRRIDALKGEATIEWSQSSLEGFDRGTVTLQFLDQYSVLLQEASLPQIAPAPLTWQERSLTSDIPSGTRAVRVSMTGTRHSGKSNDVYFDNLVLTLQDKE